MLRNFKKVFSPKPKLSAEEKAIQVSDRVFGVTTIEKEKRDPELQILIVRCLKEFKEHILRLKTLYNTACSKDQATCDNLLPVVEEYQKFIYHYQLLETYPNDWIKDAELDNFKKAEFPILKDLSVKTKLRLADIYRHGYGGIMINERAARQVYLDMSPCSYYSEICGLEMKIEDALGNDGYKNDDLFSRSISQFERIIQSYQPTGYGLHSHLGMPDLSKPPGILIVASLLPSLDISHYEIKKLEPLQKRAAIHNIAVCYDLRYKYNNNPKFHELAEHYYKFAKEQGSVFPQHKFAYSRTSSLALQAEAPMQLGAPVAVADKQTHTNYTTPIRK